MWIIGLTGAMGAGKSTLAKGLRLMGIPVHNADREIHTLLRTDSDIQQRIRILWPEVFIKEKIDRILLRSRVLSSPVSLSQLEEILYPKLCVSQKKFILKNKYLGVKIIALDVPLLMETGLDYYCHYVILASSSYSLRKQRVLGREGMTFDAFLQLDSYQMSEPERRKRADCVILTGRDKGSPLKEIKQRLANLSRLPLPQWQGKWPTTLKRDLYGTRNSFRHRNNRV